MNKINKNNAASSNNTLNSANKVNLNHDHKKKFEIGVCNKCNVEYKDVKVGIMFCSNCWKTEEKHYHHFSNSKKNFIYKTVRSGKDGFIGKTYYFENGKWISLEDKTFDDLEQNDKYNNLTAGPANNTANKASSGDNNLTAGPAYNDKVVINSLAEYFKTKSIKQISLNPEGGLTIEYEPNKVNDNNNQLTTKNITFEELSKDQELQETMNYLLEKKKGSLSQQELNALANTSSISPQNTKDNNNLKIGLAVGVGAVVIGLFAYLIVKKNKKNK